MGSRHLRFVLAAAAAAVVTLPWSVVRAHASTCGDDSSPPCPAGQTVVPDVVTAPVQDVTVEVRGSSLANVASASVQPGGEGLSIIARSDTSLTLQLPNGLGAGSYQIQLALAGQTQGYALTPFFQVAGPSAGAVLPHFSFAPAPPVGQASATTAAPAPKPVTVAAPKTSVAAGILESAILVLAVGVLGGGVVTLVYPAIRRRREVRLRDLTYSAMERRLRELWALGEQRVVPASPVTQWSDRLPAGATPGAAGQEPPPSAPQRVPAGASRAAPPAPALPASPPADREPYAPHRY